MVDESCAQEEVKASTAKKAPPKAVRADIEDEDDHETLFAYLEEHKDDVVESEDEYDEDGNLIYKAKGKSVRVFVIMNYC